MLEKTEELLCLWENEIRFTAISLPELFMRDQKEMRWLERCCALIKAGEEFPEAWKKAIGRADLQQEEKDILLSLGESFGKGDLEAQVSFIELCRLRLAEVIKKAKAEKVQQIKLYPMLGMAAGTVVLLLCL